MAHTLKTLVLAGALAACKPTVVGEYSERTYVSGKTYTPSSTYFMPMMIGKVMVMMPQTRPARYNVYLQLNGGAQYPVPITAEMYGSFNRGDCLDVTFKTEQKEGDVPRLAGVKAWHTCR
jgi:hypothetical protein